MPSAAYKKILVIRLSSIGDIVLTTPVLRSLRQGLPAAQIHFLTKKAFLPLLQHNPNVDKLIAFEGDLKATIRALKAEGYDFILDLHNNLRSHLIRAAFPLTASAVYPKQTLRIKLYTRFRIGRLPARHTVERYAMALRKLGCTLDGGSLDFPLPAAAQQLAGQLIQRNFTRRPIAVALGGNFATKRWPREHFVRLLQALGTPVILLGGPAERVDADWIAAQLEQQCLVAAGEYDLLVSAALMAKCGQAITHDSGFMHIGVALGLRLYTLWGSTVPALGFGPYKAERARVLQVDHLDCRPCSKLGHAACPLGHFKCMVDLSPESVVAAIEGDSKGDVDSKT
jgi:lipopolysaccharide heptosyltransferase II